MLCEGLSKESRKLRLTVLVASALTVERGYAKGDRQTAALLRRTERLRVRRLRAESAHDSFFALSRVSELLRFDL